MVLNVIIYNTDMENQRVELFSDLRLFTEKYNQIKEEGVENIAVTIAEI